MRTYDQGYEDGVADTRAEHARYFVVGIILGAVIVVGIFYLWTATKP